MTQDLNTLPPNAVAMTKGGRPFNKAAQELDTMLRRRLEILKEYRLHEEKGRGVLEEIVRCHTRIDQIINEMSPDA